MKIRGDIVRLYRNVHSWVGIMAGLFLFVAFYAGGMTMFEGVLESWSARPAALPAAVPVEHLPDLLQKAFAADPSAVANHTVIFHPDVAHPSSLIWSASHDREHGPARTVYAGLAPDGGLITRTQTPSQAASFINILHQRIGLPLGRESGRLVMGIVALLYAVALVSGTVVMLPSLVRNLFALRLTESLRRMWLDFHTLLGVCSLPFHIVMAATAAGFAFQRPIMTLEQSLFRPAPYVESTQGGHDGAHSHHHGGGHPGMERPLLEPGALVASLAEQVPDFEPDALVYSTRNGKLSLRVTGHDTRHVTRRPDGGYVDVDPYGGRITSMDFLPGHQGGGFLALTTIYALHFGTFGGLWGRAGYALLGFGGAFLFYSGNRLWLSSRRRRERSAGLVQDSLGTRLLSVLTAGGMLGCICGVSVVFAAVPLLPEGGHYQSIEAIFYAVLFGCVVMAAWLGGERSTRPLVGLAGVLTLLIPVTDGLSRLLLVRPITGNVIGVDIVALVYGLVLLLTAMRATRALTVGGMEETVRA